MPAKNLILASAGHSYNDMYFFLFPLLLPLLRSEFALNYSQAGLVMTVFMGSVAVFSSAWGSLGDKLGHHRLMAFGFVLASLGLLAVTLPDRFGLILVLVAVTSIGVSTFHPLGTAMISFSKKRPGLSMGIFEGSGTIGGILATVVMSLLLSSWGWRWTVSLLALPGFWLAYVFFRQTRSVRHDLQQQDIARPTSRQMLFLFFAGRTIRGLAAGAVMAFLPSFMQETWQLSPSTGSLVYSLFYLGGLAGALYFGYLADRLSRISLVVLTTVAPVLLVFLLTLRLHLGWGLLILLLIGACLTGFFPPHNRWIAEGISQEQRGRYFGIGMTLETLAVAAAPGIFGLIADQAGLIRAFRATNFIWILAGFCFLLILLREKRPADVVHQA